MKRSAAPRKNPDPENDIELLRARLQEAEETLDAIRSGHVEALMVSTPAGPRVFTLEGADHRYRRLVETMSEGALLVNPSGTILYSNAAFAAMVATRLETVVGQTLADFLDEHSRPSCAGLLAAARKQPAAEEVTLRSSTGSPVAAYLSMSPNDDSQPGVSVIVTNLAAQKRNEQVVASERLASAILDQAAEAIIVCDTNGIVTRASLAARELSADEALRQHVFASFPLRGAEGGSRPLHPASRALAGEVVASVEMILDIGGRDPMPVLCTAVPLSYERGTILGCIMSITDISVRKRDEADRASLHEAERAARSLAERARAEAEATSRTKDEFLATVSHELRTPLNAIVGWSRLLSDDAMPEGRRRHAVDVIRRNADSQARLIEDLLDVSRIISGQMRLDVKTVEPVRIITAVIETVRPALDAKEINLEVVLDSDDPTVLGDEARLQHIIWNLLSNAVKFTPRKGRILITLRRVESSIEISVEDNGEGIPRDFLPFVFDRFRQADGGLSRVHGGLGLGLAISRHLVELHGGKIAVASDGPGHGSTFVVRLPRAALRESPLPAEPLPISAKEPAPLQFDGADLTGVHVLVVEDDDDSRELLMSILVKCGARVSGADSGHAALEIFETDVPDVLVSDIGMPGMDGYSLIRRIRALDIAAGQRVPALALTAYARTEDRRRALAEGFQMHLAKPADPSEFAMAVASLANFLAMARAAVANAPPPSSKTNS
jgi:PAS domain S-box-containing protein